MKKDHAGWNWKPLAGRIGPAGVMLILFGLLCLPAFFTLVHEDEWAYTYIGKHMDFDHLPYRDFADNKGPVVYLFYKALYTVFGMNTVLWRPFFVLLVMGAAWKFHEVVRRLGGEGAGLIALATYLVFMLNTDPSGLDSLNNTETIGLFFLMWALERAHHQQDKRGEALTGAILSLSLLTNVLFWPAPLAFAILQFMKQTRTRLWFWAGLGVLPALFAVFLLSTSSFAAWWQWTVVYHVSHMENYLDAPLGRALIYMGLSVKNWLLLALVLLPFLKPSLQKFRPLMLAWLPLAIVPATKVLYSDILQIDHYGLFLIPIFALGAAMIHAQAKGPDRVLLLIPIAVSLLALAAHFTWENVQMPALKQIENARAGEIAQKLAYMKNGPVWAGIWIDEAAAYEALNGNYAGRHFFSFPLFANIPWIRDEMESEFAKEEQAGRVPYIFTTAPMERVRTDACYDRQLFFPDKIRQIIVRDYDCQPAGIIFDMDRNVTVCRQVRGAGP